LGKLDQKIGIIGAGNMGEAFAGGLIRAGVTDPSDLTVSDVSRERLDFLKESLGIQVASDNAGIFRENDIVILAVKPQVMTQVLDGVVEDPDYSSIGSRKLILSIAAGITTRNLETIFYRGLDEKSMENLPIIRAMPNMPALVLAGTSGMSGNRFVTPEDLQTATTIMEAIGIAVQVQEADLDGVTALSGSGPAYVFFLAESMIDAGIALGFDPDIAKRLTLNTLKGAVKLMEEGDDSPEILRRRVTSPGGTTEAAFKVIEGNNVKENLVEAISAAAERSRELSG
jgi:pyrroline-5-carboxylate reductase